jgi:hypothetical protein
MNEGVEFAIKVPMWNWLGLKDVIQSRQRWSHPKPRLDSFFQCLSVPQWNLDLPLYFFRNKLSDRVQKNPHQLDFFTPDDGTYEHFVIVSNKTLKFENILDFYNGRCRMEANIAEIKGEFAFDVVPTKHYQANSAHQQISLLAYNLVKNFQIDTEIASERKRTSKRTNIFHFDSLKTIRFELIHAGGRILNTAKGKVLKITHNDARKAKYEKIQNALDELGAA